MSEFNYGKIKRVPAVGDLVHVYLTTSEYTKMVKGYASISLYIDRKMHTRTITVSNGCPSITLTVEKESDMSDIVELLTPAGICWAYTGNIWNK